MEISNNQGNNRITFRKSLTPKAVLIEAKQIVKTILLYPFSPFMSKAPKSGKQEEGGGAVVFVHGYLHNASAAYSIKKELKKNEIDSVYSLTLFSLQDIKTSAEKVNRLIDRAQKENPHKKIVVVGHSMGGLASAYAVETREDKKPIARVITLGSPFQGTKLAKLGVGKAAKQMRVDSRFLKEDLQKKIKRSKIPYSHYEGGMDEILLNRAAHPKDSNAKLFKGIGHAGLLFDKKVKQQLVKEIKEVEKQPLRKKAERKKASN